MIGTNATRLKVAIFAIGFSSTLLWSCDGSTALAEDSVIKIYDASMPRDQQIELALSAAPPEVAKNASVYVLGPQGYEKAREGRNGIDCLVQRSYAQDGETTVAPMCFDAEGSRTIMLVYIRSEQLRSAGECEDTIRAEIKKEYAAGQFKVPSKPGLLYMLSCQNRLGPDPTTGKPVSFPPHLMFYAPYMTAKDLGYDSAPTVPGLALAGTPQALMVVIPGPQQLRTCPATT
jgi:hypothetical protein